MNIHLLNNNLMKYQLYAASPKYLSAVPDNGQV
jgi:hypothetical protein